MISVFVQYWQWHYGDRLKLILSALGNILRYNLDYFSVSLLLKTLFSPWHRYKVSYGRGFDFRRYSEAFTFNVISRTLGAIMRIALIFIGLATQALLSLAAAIVVLFWITLPIILVFGLMFGFIQLSL